MYFVLLTSLLVSDHYLFLKYIFIFRKENTVALTKCITQLILLSSKRQIFFRQLRNNSGIYSRVLIHMRISSNISVYHSKWSIVIVKKNPSSNVLLNRVLLVLPVTRKSYHASLSRYRYQLHCILLHSQYRKILSIIICSYYLRKKTHSSFLWESSLPVIVFR